MDIGKIETVAKTEMASRQELPFREPGWILYHGKRTGRIACRLLELLDLRVDPEVLYVAGLFHDVGKGQEHHATFGAQRIRDLLCHLIPLESLEVICEAVSLHDQRSKSDSFSDCTKLLQDADSIDHVGLIDVWMSFYWSGSHDESIHDHITFFKGDNRKRFRDYMRTHLNFNVSRQMFEDRIKKSDQFLMEFHRTYFEGM